MLMSHKVTSHRLRLKQQKERWKEEEVHQEDCWGEGKDATLRSMPSPTSLYQLRQDDWQIYPSSHASPDEDL
jgi:hypothetical protein